MSKTILMVTGSPRAGGNTDMLAEAFRKGAEAAGHTVLLYDAGKKNILPCKDCGTCYAKGVPCSFADDFNETEELLHKADVVALLSPLYWYTFSSQMKLFLDKLKAYGAHPIKAHESVLITCGAVADEERFSGLVETYRQICRGSLQWKDRGVLVCTSCGEKGTVTEAQLRKAEALGASI